MDNTILEVVMGLVLIYIVLSLLALKLQEYLVGDLLRRRVANLHVLVLEALGRDDEMRQRLFANPLISPLFEGEKVRPGNLVWGSRGPSSIPPALFARALLIELNGGRHPAEQFATPGQFITPTPASPTGASAWASARALLPGRETDWVAFEAAIAQWFKDIGDRSDGWFQREAQRWSLLIAVLLAVLLNVDTFHIVDRLTADPGLRRGLASLAERVNQSFNTPGPTAGGAAAPSARAGSLAEPVVAPEQRVADRLAQATAALYGAFFRDNEVAKFGFDASEAAEHCSGLKFSGSIKTRKLSNADTWLRVLPLVEAEVDNARLEIRRSALAPACTTAVTQTGSKTGGAGSDCDKREQQREKLNAAYRCLAHITPYVRMAVAASNDELTRKAVADAAAALDDSRRALIEMLDEAQATPSLRKLFQRDPELFADCATSAASRVRFEACVLGSDPQRLRLPLFYTAENRRQQYCRVEIVNDKPTERAARPDPAASAAAKTPWYCDASFPGEPRLGLPAMVLVSDTGGLFAGLAGMLATALFVSLGAPFWFDLLGKVSQLRSAGRSRDDEGGAGPAAAKPPTVPNLPGGPAAPSAATEPQTLSRNAFEAALLPRDIVAMQQALGVSPADGQLNQETRLKLKQRSDAEGLGATEQLSFPLYFRIVNRNPAGQPQALPGGRPQRLQAHALVQPLAVNLMAVLGFPQRIGRDETRFSDELRALAVLYRYKADDTEPDVQRKVFEQARKQRGVLDELDEALQNTILAHTGPAPAKFGRDSAPWLDWALGELGQVELGRNSREASNPRICEYLDAAVDKLGDGGDQTAWCGAFAAWVVKRHNHELGDGSNQALPQPPELPQRAENWKNWGSERAFTAVARGDVVVMRVKRDPDTFHVGFCLGADASHVWVLGGNQDAGTCVCLSLFQRGDLVHARNPRRLAA